MRWRALQLLNGNALALYSDEKTECCNLAKIAELEKELELGIGNGVIKLFKITNRKAAELVGNKFVLYFYEEAS